MSNSNDKSFSDLADDIRDLIEETVDLLQESGAAKNSPALVRARASRHIAERLQSRSFEIMNQYEMTSIRALLAWAANEQKAPPETVKAVTEVRFGVDDVTQLPRKDYEDVIKFLIDLRLDEMKN